MTIFDGTVDKADIIILIVIFAIFALIVAVILLWNKYGWTRRQYEGKGNESKMENGFNIDNVLSVKILEMTQIYEERKRENQSVGSVGALWDKNFKPVYSTTYTTETVPVGVEYSFSITWKDNTSSVLRFMSGTPECDRLLQFIENNEEEKIKKEEAAKKRQNQQLAIKRESEDSSRKRMNDKGEKIVHLMSGRYEVGVEFPEGFYEFWSENTNEINCDSVSVYTKKDAKENDSCKLCHTFQNHGPGVVRLDKGDILRVEGSSVYVKKAKPISFD